jgi:hypothetical protein
MKRDILYYVGAMLLMVGIFQLLIELISIVAWLAVLVLTIGTIAVVASFFLLAIDHGLIERRIEE